MPDGSTVTTARVAVLLSTYNGARYVDQQLDSLLAQTHTNWQLYWRDDFSTDQTQSLLRRFAETSGKGRCLGAGNDGHIGVTHSFLGLLRAAVRDEPDAVAFADQDDVWLPDKIARGVAMLAAVPAGTPALYCARQILVDERLARIAESAPLRRSPCFAAALTQNVATGCTVLMNNAAANLVARSRAPAATLHDWWSYLVVAAAGGVLLADSTPVVLYRQHPGSLIGAPASLPRRALAALRRGPGAFMGVMRQHVAALADQPGLLAPDSRDQLAIVSRALAHGSPGSRAAALRLPGFRRQTWPENLLFRLWFLTG